MFALTAPLLLLLLILASGIDVDLFMTVKRVRFEQTPNESISDSSGLYLLSMAITTSVNNNGYFGRKKNEGKFKKLKIRRHKGEVERRQQMKGRGKENRVEKEKCRKERKK